MQAAETCSSLRPDFGAPGCLIHPSCTGQTSRTCTGCLVHQRLRRRHGAWHSRRLGLCAAACCNAHIAAGVLLMDTFKKEESMYSATDVDVCLRSCQCSWRVRCSSSRHPTCGLRPGGGLRPKNRPKMGHIIGRIAVVCNLEQPPVSAALTRPLLDVSSSVDVDLRTRVHP
jgi:hypothetical protein